MSEELLNHPYAEDIWLILLATIGNKYGTAGLMGNLRAESGLYPDRVQGDIPYSDYSKNYTALVDGGAISEYDFVYNGPNGGGYGLAQWTYYTRKQALYDMWKNSQGQLGAYSSIGDVRLACDYLLYELNTSYSDVMDVLKNATSIREASDIVLHQFENPADQSTSVEELRESLGLEVFETFDGKLPDTPTPSKRKQLSKLLLFAVATDL